MGHFRNSDGAAMWHDRNLNSLIGLSCAGIPAGFSSWKGFTIRCRFRTPQENFSHRTPPTSEILYRGQDPSVSGPPDLDLICGTLNLIIHPRFSAFTHAPPDYDLSAINAPGRTPDPAVANQKLFRAELIYTPVLY